MPEFSLSNISDTALWVSYFRAREPNGPMRYSVTHSPSVWLANVGFRSPVLCLTGTSTSGHGWPHLSF
jgi:hypothetical protein